MLPFRAPVEEAGFHKRSQGLTTPTKYACWIDQSIIWLADWSMIWLMNWWINQFIDILTAWWTHELVTQLVKSALVMVAYFITKEFTIRNGICRQPWCLFDIWLSSLFPNVSKAKCHKPCGASERGAAVRWTALAIRNSASWAQTSQSQMYTYIYI